MSKYDLLWDCVKKNGSQSFRLTFEEIHRIVGMPTDYSFSEIQKGRSEYDYKVGKYL